MWWTLVEKDFLLVRRGWLWHVAFMAATGLTALWFAAHSASGFVAGLGLLAASGLTCVVALPAYAYRGTAAEWNRHAAGWLNLPASGAALLVATATALALWVLESGAVVGVLAVGVSRWRLAGTAFSGSSTGTLQAGPGLHSVEPQSSLGLHVQLAASPHLLALGAIGLVAVGVYIAVWVMGGLVALRAVRHRWGSLGRLVLTVAIAAVPLAALPKMTARLQLSHAWPVVLSLFSTRYGSVAPPLTVYVGPLLVDLVFVVLAFWAAVWVLDRKAEV